MQILADAAAIYHRVTVLQIQLLVYRSEVPVPQPSLHKQLSGILSTSAPHAAGAVDAAKRFPPSAACASQQGPELCQLMASYERVWRQPATQNVSL